MIVGIGVLFFVDNLVSLIELLELALFVPDIVVRTGDASPTGLGWQKVLEGVRVMKLLKSQGEVTCLPATCYKVLILILVLIRDA